MFLPLRLFQLTLPPLETLYHCEVGILAGVARPLAADAVESPAAPVPVSFRAWIAGAKAIEVAEAEADVDSPNSATRPPLWGPWWRSVRRARCASLHWRPNRTSGSTTY